MVLSHRASEACYNGANLQLQSDLSGMAQDCDSLPHRATGSQRKNQLTLWSDSGVVYARMRVSELDYSAALRVCCGRVATYKDAGCAGFWTCPCRPLPTF